MASTKLLQDGLKVRNAKLYVHLPSSCGHDQSNDENMECDESTALNYGDEAWIHVYYIQIDKKTGTGSPIQGQATRVTLYPDRGGWADIDIMEILSIWLKYPEENKGLYIKVVSKSGELIPVGVQHQRTNVS